MSQLHTYTQATCRLIRLLGKQIKLHRKQKGWSESDLAQRAGIARATLQKIEAGSPKTQIGFVLECAILTNIDLSALQQDESIIDTMLSLHPQSIRSTKNSRLDDDF